MTELAPPLRWAMFHFGSGDALFVGLFLLFLATRAEAWNWRRRWASVSALVGMSWIVLSAWPYVALQVGLIAIAAIWLGYDALPTVVRKLPRFRWRRVVVALFLVAAVVELPYHRPLRLNVSGTPQIAVIGDSVTAGLEATDRTWSRQAAERFGWTVFDASQQGATAHTAPKQLAALDGRGQILVLEIGGIDILEQTPVDSFVRDLEALLQSARKKYPTMVMTEIPLPPLCNRYGMVQRRLSRKYGVRLIPKREFIAALASAGGTVDGMHLSDDGQTRLAEMMRRALSGAESSSSGEYHRCEARDEFSAVIQPQSVGP